MGRKLEKDPELRNRQLASHRQYAVRQAWKNEKALVQQGRGTRDWTKEQQKELLTNNKVHGMQGHHMKSVKHYPQQAINPKNIQFLNHEEHLQGAHRGKYRNVCNGYYDPQNGKMNEFKGRELRPVPNKALSDPLSRQEVRECIKAGRNHVQKPDTAQKKNYSGKTAARKSGQPQSSRNGQSPGGDKAKHSPEAPARERTGIRPAVIGHGTKSVGRSSTSVSFGEKTGIRPTVTGHGTKSVGHSTLVSPGEKIGIRPTVTGHETKSGGHSTLVSSREKTGIRSTVTGHGTKSIGRSGAVSSGVKTGIKSTMTSQSVGTQSSHSSGQSHLPGSSHSRGQSR